MNNSEKVYSNMEMDLMSYLNEKIPNVPLVTRHEIAAYLTAQVIISVNDNVNAYVREMKREIRRG